MMSVYMNAVCTFSICGEDPNLGLFFYREPKSLLCWSETYEMDMATTDPKTHAFVHNLLEWNKAVIFAKVNTRGWVLQESLLSPRILYLGNDVLFWECDQLLTSEIAPGMSDFSRTNIAAKPGGLARKWPNLVETFMEKDLSHEKDRLFAIAGIAQLFAKRTSETFLVGLRKTRWAHDLLWFPWRPSSLKERSPSGAFPSWSWAACPTPLSWPPSSGMRLATMRDDGEANANTLAHLSATTLEAFECDIYGKPGSMSLDISCFLIPAQYEEFDDEIGGFSAHTEWFQHPHNPQYARVKSAGFLYSNSHPEMNRCGPSLITLPIGERTSERTDFSPSCFVLPLLDESAGNLFEDPDVTDYPRGDYRFFDLHALIVQERPRNSADVNKTEQIGGKEYVRIGMLTLTLEGYYQDSPEWLNEYKACRGMINGIWDQMRRHESVASEAVDVRNFVTDLHDEISHIVGGKMSEHQADVTVQANWGTIRLV